MSFTDVNIATLDLMLWYDYISFPIDTLFSYNEAAFWHNCFCFPLIIAVPIVCPAYV